MAIISKSIPPQRPVLPQSTLSHFLSYVRTSGIVSLMLGGASMMQGPDFFVWTVWLVYTGLALLALDALLEEWPHVWVKYIFVGVVLTVTCLFSWGWVFIDTPLHVTGMVNSAEYPEGTVIAGIDWSPKYTELILNIHNGTKRNYEDLKILIKPNYPIAAIAQLSTYSGVSFVDRFGMDMRMVEIEGDRQTAHPQVLIATDAGYIVRCDKLPGMASLKIVLAIVDVKNDPHPHFPSQPGESMVRPEDLLIMKLNNGSTYWFGHKGIDHYTPRLKPNTVEISGEYIAAQRKRNISMELKVG